MLNIKYKQKTNTQYEEEQKMKKFDFVIILIAATFLISGCAQALTGAAEAGFATWGMTEKAKIEKQEREQEAKTSIPNVSNVELLAKMDVNDYSIEVIRAKILPDRILFGAKKQGQIIGSFETNQAGFQKFTSMTESDKKQFLREKFLKYGGFDLGPVESAPSLPTPGFAPTPR